jgi:hypothetical protein
VVAEEDLPSALAEEEAGEDLPSALAEAEDLPSVLAEADLPYYFDKHLFLLQ